MGQIREIITAKIGLLIVVSPLTGSFNGSIDQGSFRIKSQARQAKRNGIHAWQQKIAATCHHL